MKNINRFFITIIVIALNTAAYSQIKCYQHYHRQVRKNIERHNYLKALDNIEYANACPDKPNDNNLKKLNKICRDSIARLIIRIKAEQNKTQKALLRAEQMKLEAETALSKNKLLQKQIETAIFDKAVKEFFPNWKGVFYMTKPNGNLNDKAKEIINKIYKLDLSNNALNKLPKEVRMCKNLEYIDLRGNNNIDWQKVYEDTKELKEDLEFSASIKNMDSIPKQLHRKIKHIEIVDANLKNIPELVFEQKHLEALTISANIDSLPNKLKNLQNLSVLNCNFNQLNVFSPAICSIKGLKELYLNSNNIKVIPGDIAKLQNLKLLSLNDNNLSELPKKLFRLQKLHTISLNNNQLSIIPDEIKHLKDLEILNLAGNQLKELPKVIWYLHYLSELRVANNKLKKLPHEILNLHYLTYLDAQNNELQTIPKSIWTLRNLAYINLSNNKITDLPFELWGLYSLKYFNLSNNQLTVIPKNISNLKKVETLNLSGNKLVKLSKAILSVKSLTCLNLSNNELVSLPNDIKNLNNLQELYLNGNKLTKIPAGIAKLNNLRILYIDDLQLDTKKFTAFLKSCPKKVQLTENIDKYNNTDSKYLRIYVKKIEPEWEQYRF